MEASSELADSRFVWAQYVYMFTFLNKNIIVYLDWDVMLEYLA